MNHLLPRIGRIVGTLIFVALAIVAVVLIWEHYEDDPWTRDGIVEADTVKVSADVSGLVTEVNVRDNQCVRPGDVLFTVDRIRYAAQLASADANVQSSQASVKSAVAKAAESKASLDNAVREEQRYLALGRVVSSDDHERKVAAVRQRELGYQQAQLSVQQARATLDQAQLAPAPADVQGAQARLDTAVAGSAAAKALLDEAMRDEQRNASRGELVSKEDTDEKVTDAKKKDAEYKEALASVESATASLRQAEANRRKSEIDMERSSVRASVEGLVTNFKLLPGDYISSGSPQFALVDVNSFHVLGYLEETKLHRFDLGDRARVNLLGDDRPAFGRVSSIAGGITDRQTDPSGNLLPNIEPSFSWIRLAQRVPVRVTIEQLPAGLRLVAGRTATVTIFPGTKTVSVNPAATTSNTPSSASGLPQNASLSTQPCGHGGP